LSLAFSTNSLAQESFELRISSPTGQTLLSLSDLDALPQTQFTTTTIWTNGTTEFSGVSLKTLLGHLSATGTTLEMAALNDYAVSMPLTELEDSVPIVATRMNGEIMSARDKGPFWVVYPYDNNPRYRTETNFTRSIWQLRSLQVED
jgi:hypothetical protein